MAMIETLREGPPYTIYLARANDDFWPPEWLITWYVAKTVEWFKAKGVTVVSRGVSLGRLPFVLENGIDVPPGAPLWVEIGIEKAWEYGGWPKLLLVFAQAALQPCHLVLPLSTSEQELEVYKTKYQTVLRREDRGEIYLSRLRTTDRRIGSDYEQVPSHRPSPDREIEPPQGWLVLEADSPRLHGAKRQSQREPLRPWSFGLQFPINVTVPGRWNSCRRCG
jgi:hypothetical protein